MKRSFGLLCGLLAVSALSGCGDDLGSTTSNVDELVFQEGTPEALSVLALLNDPAVTVQELDEGAKLASDAAASLVAHRDGPDAAVGTADDDLFDSIAEVDSVPNVGRATILLLRDYAKAQGYLEALSSKKLEVVFSPQLYPDSHLPRVAQLIDQAQRTIDIAMYSYSDSGVQQALERAVDRGIKVRFMFEVAGVDKGLTGPALANSKSAGIEKLGVDVRYVTKVMHHKFMLVDGPRDDGAAADKAILVTGSANWSNGAATKYDENTLFMQGYPELVLRMQREFNLLWDHSGDFVYDATLPYEHSTFVIEDASIPDDPAIDVKFTSANFKIRETSFGVTGTNTVSDLLVAGIQGATKSIHIASGHFRSRPVAEAVMAKAAADPSLDIRVMLDGQEYISKSGHDSQTSNLNSCLAAAAGKEGQTRACLDKGFYYGYLASTSGVPVRYKYYAYRWNASYAVQMHNKVMIVDGDELFTGSYNLSDNAEHNTFENMFHFQGPEYSSLVDQYEVTFEKLWELGRAEGVLGKLQETISTSSSIPLVFDPVSLEWQEVTDLKSLIRANCTAVDTAEYRANPTKHMYCPR